MELQCIKSSFYSQFSRLSELLNDLMDTLYCNCIRCLFYVCLVKEVSRYESSVPDLNSCLTTIFMDCFSYFLQFISVCFTIQSEI